MTQAVKSALADATFYSDHTDYALIKFPPAAITVAAGILAEIGEPFGAMIVDKDEVTLVADRRVSEVFQSRLTGAVVSAETYRLISVDVELEMGLVGFIAYLSRALAEAGISILPYAAYTRDHLLVSVKDFDRALIVLNALKGAR